MGAIQSAMNQAMGSVAVAMGAAEKINADVDKDRAEEAHAKAAKESIEKLTKNYNPGMFSPGATAFNQDKGTLALLSVATNQAGKFTQQNNFQQRLEASKGVTKASRKTIGGKK